MGLLMIIATLSAGAGTGLAQSPAAAQPQNQSLQCDGSARSTDTPGQLRSVSNCDRKAAAERSADRRAAVAAGRPDPGQVSPDEAYPSEEGGTDE